MEAYLKNLLICAPILLYLLSALLNALAKNKNVHYVLSILLPTFSFALVCLIAKTFLQNQYSLAFFNITDTIEVFFKIDLMGIVFAMLCAFLSMPASVYAVAYIYQNNEPEKSKFLFYFNISIAITLGLAFSGNLMTLFIFYEFLTLSTFPLVTHKKSQAAIKSGKKYLGYLMFSSLALFFPAVLIVYNLTGTTEFGPDLAINIQSQYTRCALLLLFLFGIAKAAVMPMHKWLPSAMVAPTPVSALLHAVAVVKAGVFCVIKIIFYVFFAGGKLNDFASSCIIYIAGFTVIIASLIALKKTKIKELLAYSTISQLSYIIMAAGIFTKSAIVSAILYMVLHGFAKITLFFTAGAFYTVKKYENLQDLKGIASSMPITSVAFCIGAFAMIGLPPTVAFLGKYNIFHSAFDADKYFVVFVLLASTLLNAKYFLPVVLDMTYKGRATFKYQEAKPSMYLPYVATSFCVLLLCYWFDAFLAFLDYL